MTDNVHDNTVSTPPLPRRAVLYVRTDGPPSAPDPPGQSAQEAELRRYAQAHGFEVVGVYGDAGAAGGEEPARDRLLEDARADAFDAVLVTSADRLAAAGAAYDRVRDALTEVGVRIVVTSADDWL